MKNITCFTFFFITQNVDQLRKGIMNRIIPLKQKILPNMTLLKDTYRNSEIYYMCIIQAQYICVFISLRDKSYGCKLIERTSVARSREISLF